MPHSRIILRVKAPESAGKYGESFGQVKHYAGDDTPLGYIELDQWYWKRDFPDVVTVLKYMGKKSLVVLEQEDFFKVSMNST